jgi:hypothetical protein
MSTLAAPFDLRQMPVLLRGAAGPIAGWLTQPSARRVGFYVAVIMAGAGCFGATIGWWRAPTQALYTAIKLPLILLLTTLGNALWNGMLAPLLGLNLTFRQTALAILMSFAIASAILGAFSPVMFFLVWNVPPSSTAGPVDWTAYRLILVTQAAAIAFAGVAANLRLGQLLRHVSGRPAIARHVLLAWLAGNLFLGSQFAWVLRPFIGSPGLPLEFLRPDPFASNFYEALWGALKQLLFG